MAAIVVSMSDEEDEFVPDTSS
jgi:hypothetical protein